MKYIVLLVFINFSIISQGQTIKYKEIYSLLRDGKTVEAIPQLLLFLQQEPKHPNANYWAGKIYFDKAKSNRSLVEADSCILFFNRSIDNIGVLDVNIMNAGRFPDFKGLDATEVLADGKRWMNEKVVETNKLKEELKENEIEKQKNLKLEQIKDSIEEAMKDNKEYLYPVFQNNLYGFINNSGEWVIKPCFNHAEAFCDGMYKVTIKEQFGIWKSTFINSLGQLLPKQFESITNFNNGIARAYAIVGTTSYCSFIDRNGEVIFKVENTNEMGIYRAIDNYESSNEFIKYVNRTTSPAQYGFLNRSGQIIIPAKFTDVGEFHEGLCKVAIQGQYGFIDSLGKFVIMPKFSEAGNFSEGLCKVDGGYINKKGEYIIKSYLDSREFHNGLAITVSPTYNGMGRLYGFIDKTGTNIIESTDKLEFENAKNFSNGLAPVKIHGKWGYINIHGKIIIEPIFDEADIFLGNRAKVTVNSGVIRKSGEYVIGEGYITKDGKFTSYTDFPEKNINELIITFINSRYVGPEDVEVNFKGEDGNHLTFLLGEGIKNDGLFFNNQINGEDKTVKQNVGKKYKIKYINYINEMEEYSDSILGFEEVPEEIKTTNPDTINNSKLLVTTNEKTWKTIIASYKYTEQGDYLHIVFEGEDGEKYDLGGTIGDYRFGSYNFEDETESKKYFNKKFKITWRYITTRGYDPVVMKRCFYKAPIIRVIEMIN